MNRSLPAALAHLASTPFVAAYSSGQDTAVPSTSLFIDIGCSRDGNLDLKPDNASGCLDDLDGSVTCVATDNGNDCDGRDDYAVGVVTVELGFGSGGTV